MGILDIHTHHTDSPAGQAIISCSPGDFRPAVGRWYSVGLHPWRTASADTEWDDLCRAAAHPQVVAIGEAGIDRLRGGDIGRQMEVFARQARLAEQVGKPLIIHMVRTLSELLAVRRQVHPRVPWIVHGFRGSATMATQLLAHGLQLSFGALYNDEAMRRTPTDRLFLETDEATVDIDIIYRRAAAVRQTDVDELRQALVARAAQTFFLPLSPKR